MARFVFVVLLLAAMGLVSGTVCLSPKMRTEKCNKVKHNAETRKFRGFRKFPVSIKRCILKACRTFPEKRVLNKKTGRRSICIDNNGVNKAMNKALRRCYRKRYPKPW